MKRLTPQLLAELKANPQGLGMEELERRFRSRGSRSTVQRTLNRMRESDLVIRRGKGPATLYALTEKGKREGEAESAMAAPVVEPQFGRAVASPPPVIGMAAWPEARRWLPQPGEPWSQGVYVRENEDEAVPPRPLAPPGSHGHTDRELSARTGPQFSEEAMAVRQTVRQPSGFRAACGYRREFLERYTPNSTEYLPAKLRAHLRAVGQSEEMAALPPGTYARQVMDRLLIDLSWNSSRLEGNTFSLLETDYLLQLVKNADPARYIETQMILNHKAAIEFLVEEPSEPGFNRYTFLNLHAILTEGLLKDPGSEGRLRLIPVGIGGTVYHPVSTPSVIEECFDLILEKTAAIADPLEQAFFLMVHVPYLQPFEDGNKRVSRVGANLPLIQRNLSPLSFIDVPIRDYIDGLIAVYELTRIDVLREVFAWAYERSAGRYATVRREMGEPDRLHVQYRGEIKSCVRDVVVQRLNKPEAARALREWAARHVTADDRARFIELVETQLLFLDEGRIARVRVRPAEFHAWLPRWNTRA